MELHGQNLIGNDVTADGQDTFHAINPATGDPLQPAVTDATNAEINQALEKAEDAFRIYRQKARMRSPRSSSASVTKSSHSVTP